MDIKDEALLKSLDIYFTKYTNDNNKGEFHFIENILKDEVFDKKSFTADDIVNAIHCDPDIKFSVRGYKIRPKPLELNSDRSIILSKKLAAVLRHGLFKSGLETFNGCYVKLNELLKLPQFQDFTKEEVFQTVNCPGKRRYEIIENESEELIGALQGHSLPIENDMLNPIDSSYELKTAYHGTFYTNWESIKSEGLKVMGRKHIHLYTINSAECVRDLAEIIIEIDLESAIKDGLKFFISRNNIILTEGENGVLKACYFNKAWDVKSNEVIYSNPQVPSTPSKKRNRLSISSCQIG